MKNIFNLYFYFFCSIKKHKRTLFYITDYQESYSGYFLSFTNVQLTMQCFKLEITNFRQTFFSKW